MKIKHFITKPGVVNISLIKDERGQGAAEYILLFGGVIVIAIAALMIYRDYVNSTNPLNAATDVNGVKNNMVSHG